MSNTRYWSQDFLAHENLAQEIYLALLTRYYTDKVPCGQDVAEDAFLLASYFLGERNARRHVYKNDESMLDQKRHPA